MLIGNKKVSQLIELTPTEVSTDDLFLIIDSSAKESKKIQASNLIAWLNGSGSIYATNAILAATASYVADAHSYLFTGTFNNCVFSLSMSHFYDSLQLYLSR